MADVMIIRRGGGGVGGLTSIEDAVVTLTQDSFTYDGNEHGPTVESVVLDGVTLVEGTDYIVAESYGVNAGTYYIRVLGLDKYCEVANVPWQINKAARTITASPSSIEFAGPAGTTGTSTISFVGDGTVSVSSSSTNIVTVSYANKVITVTGVNAGSATITVNVSEGTNYLAAQTTIGVTYLVVSDVLNNNDWSTIQAEAAAGTAANYWSVGDRKAVTLNGTVGKLTFSNNTYYAYILGINHNSYYEGNGIHFQFGFTAASGGVHVAFCDSSYENEGSGAMFHMNSSHINNGGWESSYMRGTICSQFLSALPSALQSAIASTTKYTDNGDNTTSVTSTSDKIFLLAEFEIHGTKTHAYKSEQYFQEQYSYYANGNSKIMYKHNDTSTTVYWWTRSPDYSYSNRFCIVSTDGSAVTVGAAVSIGFAPCFKVG